MYHLVCNGVLGQRKSLFTPSRNCTPQNPESYGVFKCIAWHTIIPIETILQRCANLQCAGVILCLTFILNIHTVHLYFLYITSLWRYIEVVFCSGGGLLSVKECFQWDRVPSILPMRTKSQGNEVILSTYYHSNLIRTTPLLIEFWLSKFKTKNQLS